MTTAPFSLSPLDGRAARIDAVLIGASAGGVQALLELLAPLPRGYGLPIVVVLHLPPDRDSTLSDLLRARTRLPVHEARDKEPIAAGTVYVAPPAYHLLVEPDRSFSLSCEPPHLYSRPSIDVLFESAAHAYGPSLAAIVLTGASEDGAEGLACVKRRGGLTAVQDPAEAQSRTMPEAAIRRSPPDFVLPLTHLHTLLLQLDRHDH